MDPKACLMYALNCVEHREWDDATSALMTYFRWRARGGFEPTMDNGMWGDDYHETLTNKVAEGLGI